MRACIFLLVFAGIATAQTTRTIQAIGSSNMQVTPDQASLDVGVVTSAATAQESAALNASQTTAVINALKAALGNNGTVQTQYYSVSPRYAANSSTVNGYTTFNTLRVISTDLSGLGRLIDAANGAGANTVGGLGFGLQDPEPYVQQALSAATKQAMAHAGAIASGLGSKVGAVVSAQENSSYAPVIVNRDGGGATLAATTPIQTSTVNVYANVTLVVQLQ